MKTKKMTASKWMAGFALGATALLAQLAQAEIRGGTWYSPFNRTLIFIKSVPNEADAFGLILGGSKDSPLVALFRVEETSTGLQTWVPLYRDSDGEMLVSASDREPALTVQVDPRGQLRASITRKGQALGFKDFEAQSNGNYEWSDLPSSTRYVKQSRLEGTLSPVGHSWSLVLEHEAGRGDSPGVSEGVFVLESAFPGVAAAHAQVPSSESSTGMKEDSKVVFAAATIRKIPCIGPDREKLLVIHVGEEKSMAGTTPFFPAATINIRKK
jgi:hypothetical protein